MITGEYIDEIFKMMVGLSRVVKLSVKIIIILYLSKKLLRKKRFEIVDSILSLTLYF